MSTVILRGAEALHYAEYHHIALHVDAAQDVEPFRRLREEQAQLEAARTAEEQNVADLLAQRPSG